MEFRKIKGAIFDMDGTLVDSFDVLKKIAIMYLDTMGIEHGPENDELIKNMSLDEAAVYFIEELGIDKTFRQIIDEIDQMMELYYFEKFRLKQGAGEAVRFLWDRGIKMCVATTTDRYLAEACLKRTGLMKYFEGAVTCTEAGAPKSRPDVFLKAAELIGTDPGSTLVFEDSLLALKTAANAGFRTVGVYEPWQWKTEKEIRSFPDAYLENLADCRLIFETQNLE